MKNHNSTACSEDLTASGELSFLLANPDVDKSSVFCELDTLLKEAEEMTKTEQDSFPSSNSVL